MRPASVGKLISIIVIAALLLAVGAGLVRAYGLLRGEGLSRIIERLLQERLRGGISLGASRLSLFPSPGIIFAGCAVGDPSRFHVRAKYAEVVVSFRELMRGRVRISRIRLIRPFVTINLDGLKAEKGGKPYLLPAIEAYGARGRVLFRGREIIVAGGLSGEFTLEKRERLRVDGYARFQDCFIFIGGRPGLINGRIGMDGDEIHSDEMSLSSAEGRALVSGLLSMETPARFQGAVSLEGVRFGLRGGSLRPPEKLLADADISLLNCSYRGIAITRASAHAVYAEGRLRLQGLALSLADGRLSGNVDIAPGESPRVDLKMELRQAPIESYLRALSGVQPMLSGLLDCRGRIHGRLDAPSGELDMLARHGRVRGYPLVSNIFALLNVYRILKKGRLSLSGAGMEYDWMAAAVVLINGIAEIRSFSLDSAALQMAASGRCDLRSRTMDLSLAVQPLETVDKTIGALPVLGWTLAGDSRRFIVLRLRARGRIGDPSVRVEFVETLAAPIARTLGRALGLPLQILVAPQRLLP